MSNGVKWAVVDVETTGFSEKDQVVEIACMLVTAQGLVVEEYETLVRPDGDPGPVRAYGLTPEMLEAAPPFASVAPEIAVRLDGNVVVAHNFESDRRMISREFARIDGSDVQLGDGVCTYELTREKLTVAANQAGMRMADRQARTALDNARAAAHLLVTYISRVNRSEAEAASCAVQGRRPHGITVRRPEAPPRRGSLHALASHTSWPKNLTSRYASYLDVLDRCLDDSELTKEEHIWLDQLAADLRISVDERHVLHEHYYKLLIDQIKEDGIVTEQEVRLATEVGDALDIPVNLRVTSQS